MQTRGTYVHDACMTDKKRTDSETQDRMRRACSVQRAPCYRTVIIAQRAAVAQPKRMYIQLQPGVGGG